MAEVENEAMVWKNGEKNCAWIPIAGAPAQATWTPRQLRQGLTMAKAGLEVR